MSIDMSQFFQVFFDETEELLAEKEKLLMAVDVSAPDMEDIDAIFRTAHSIKGGAATFGFTDMTEVTHILESLLDRIRKGELTLTAEHVDAFLIAKDVLKMQLDGHRHGMPVDQDAVKAVCTRLQSQLQDAAAHGMSAASPPAPAPAGTAGSFRIELPQIPPRDVDALAAELGLLGAVGKEILDDGRHVFILVTDESLDAILAICSFVLEPSDLIITLQPAVEENVGYGFFEPLESRAQDVAPIGAPSRNIEDEQGYGFFEPLAAAPSRSIEDEQGYGFFEPLASLAQNTAPTAVPAKDIEDEQGYGFFAPFKPLSETIAAETVAITAVESVATGRSGDPKQHAGEAKPSARRETDKSTASQESSSIRVSIEKVDQLINLVGELVITHAMIEQRVSAFDPMLHERLLSSVSQLTRNTRDLQESVMSIRMMPMDYVFSRFPRMVRDLAGKLGKKVEFVTHGAATELDKGLIERIIDPLTHLVRNSIDHGIEMPEVRVAAGKSESGKLSLSAAHQGGNIVIEVSDDGGGLNRERIIAKGRQQGLPVSDDMPDGDVWQLIFAPGFSTAETVTDVSGRGVGMDVVKRNIAAMGGMVDIRSAKGFGSTISIALPLTLAILEGMSVKVGDEIYILPLSYVIESLQPAASNVKEVAGQGRVVKVRGEYLPLISLYQLFGIDPCFTDPSAGIVVILEADGRKAALFVDELVGQQQVVVKNIESNYRKVAGISGATILGDGGVALILDVSALLRSSRRVNDVPVPL